MSDTEQEEWTGDTLYSLDFQRSVLKLIASNLSFAANYGTLIKPEYFENQPLRLIFNIIKDYVFQYEKELTLSDASVIIAQELQRYGFTSEQAKEMDAEARGVFNRHIKSETWVTDQLLKFVRRQELKAALFQSVDIMEREGSYEQVLKIIDSAVSVGGGIDEGLKFDDLFNLPKNYRLKYNPIDLITTGFDDLDKCLEGGMAPGELHVMQAPPKAGKTSWGVNIGAANLRKRKNVFHITCEVKRDDLAMKYAMNITGLTKEEICDTSTDVYELAMKRFNKLKPNLYINYWTEKTANCMTFRSWISRIRAKTGVKPDLIIVDYDDLILPISGFKPDDMYGGAGEIYSDLIQLADYFKCPVYTFAQPQRDAWEWPNEGKLITFDKLAHSALKAHKCYSLCSLNFANDSSSGILYVDIVRRGESKVKIKMKKEMSKSRFIEEGRA